MNNRQSRWMLITFLIFTVAFSINGWIVSFADGNGDVRTISISVTDLDDRIVSLDNCFYNIRLGSYENFAFGDWVAGNETRNYSSEGIAVDIVDNKLVVTGPIDGDVAICLQISGDHAVSLNEYIPYKNLPKAEVSELNYSLRKLQKIDLGMDLDGKRHTPTQSAFLGAQVELHNAGLKTKFYVDYSTNHFLDNSVASEIFVSKGLYDVTVAMYTQSEFYTKTFINQDLTTSKSINFSLNKGKLTKRTVKITPEYQRFTYYEYGMTTAGKKFATFHAPFTGNMLTFYVAPENLGFTEFYLSEENSRTSNGTVRLKFDAHNIVTEELQIKAIKVCDKNSSYTSIDSLYSSLKGESVLLTGSGKVNNYDATFYGADGEELFTTQSGRGFKHAELKKAKQLCIFPDQDFMVKKASLFYITEDAKGNTQFIFKRFLPLKNQLDLDGLLWSVDTSVNSIKVASRVSLKSEKLYDSWSSVKPVTVKVVLESNPIFAYKRTLFETSSEGKSIIDVNFELPANEVYLQHKKVAEMPLKIVVYVNDQETHRLTLTELLNGGQLPAAIHEGRILGLKLRADQTERLNNSITRGECAEYLYNAFASNATMVSAITGKVEAPKVTESVIKDVPLSHARRKAIEWVITSGIMGMDKGYFNPDKPVTKSEMAWICYKAYMGIVSADKKVIIPNEAKFLAMKITDAKEIAKNDRIPVSFCIDQKIFGKPDTYFNPKQFVKRSTFIEALVNLYGLDVIVQGN